MFHKIQAIKATRNFFYDRGMIEVSDLETCKNIVERTMAKVFESLGEELDSRGVHLGADSINDLLDGIISSGYTTAVQKNLDQYAQNLIETKSELNQAQAELEQILAGMDRLIQFKSVVRAIAYLMEDSESHPLPSITAISEFLQAALLRSDCARG